MLIGEVKCVFKDSPHEKIWNTGWNIHLKSKKGSVFPTSLYFFSFLSVLLSTFCLMFYCNVNYVSFSGVLPFFDIDPEPFTA